MKTYPKDIRERTFQFAPDSLRIYKEINTNDSEYTITKQLSRSATSVGANVREAKNSVSKNDFLYRMAVAQKECDESIYWLELMDEFIERDIEKIKTLKKEASEILLILSAIIIKTKQNLKNEKLETRS